MVDLKNLDFTDLNLNGIIKALSAIPIRGLAKVALAIAPMGACPDGYSFIPAGPFIMESDWRFNNEKSILSVYTDAYCLAKNETTNAQYQKIFPGVRSNAKFDALYRKAYPGPYHDGSDNFNAANKPVINVSWKDAAAYCKAIGGRLPTEAEWEKAARGPLGLEYGTRSGKLSIAEANYDSHGTTNVCSYPENGYGLCDMAGNVWEWTNDWFAEGAYELINVSNSQGPDSGDFKVVRGGGWTGFNMAGSHVMDYFAYRPNDHFGVVGFRCVGDRKDLSKF